MATQDTDDIEDMPEILDVYRSNKFIYIDLNPGNFIENSDEEIYAKLKVTPEPLAQKLFKSVNYNIAIYLEITIPDEIHSISINGTVYPIKDVLSLAPVTAQLCLVFKNEWPNIPIVIDYYRRVHRVERFILYDNNSTEPPPKEILEDPQIQYIQWTIPYTHTLINPPDSGPDWVIIAQNSAYSHCLKRFNQAIWTIFMDTDEFLVRRRDAPPLKSVLESKADNVNTIVVKGFWAGCNKFTQKEIYKNLTKLSRRGDKFCMNKLILRTSKHKYTDCIHSAYITDGRAETLPVNQGMYFFHLYTASAKTRKCECRMYCQIPDKSFIESWAHAK